MTNQEIIDQTNQLARELYALRGYCVDENYQFKDATHPQEVETWEAACIAQEVIAGTEISEVLSQLEEEMDEDI